MQKLTKTEKYQCAFGALFLLIYFFVVAFGSILFGVVGLLYASGQMAIILNVSWYVAPAFMLFRRSEPGRRGYYYAVFVFFALWFAGSVVSRLVIQFDTTAEVWARPAPVEAQKHRTLIVEAGGSQYQLRRVLMGGHIDRLVEVHINGQFGVLKKIEEITIAPADQCSAEEMTLSTWLARTGRTEECFKSRPLNAIPDGLIVRMVHRYKLISRQHGCCNELQFGLRQGGVERPVATWFSGLARVLSYVPSYGFFNRPTSLWSPGTGPVQLVWLGQPDLKIELMVSAMYGMDFSKPIKLAKIDLGVLTKRAEVATQSSDPSVRKTGLEMVWRAVMDEKYIDESAINAAVNFIGTFQDGKVGRIFSRLNTEQKSMFLEKLLERLTTPGSCPNCYSTSLFILPASLPDAKSINIRATDIFCKNPELAAWQYQVLIGLADGRINSPSEKRSSFFRCVVSEQTNGFAQRATAFGSAFGILTLEEVGEVRQRMQFVPDNQLSRFLFRVHIARSLKQTESQFWNEYWSRVLDRISSVSDVKVRVDIQRNVPREFHDHPVFKRVD